MDEIYPTMGAEDNIETAECLKEKKPKQDQLPTVIDVVKFVNASDPFTKTLTRSKVSSTFQKLIFLLCFLNS